MEYFIAKNASLREHNSLRIESHGNIAYPFSENGLAELFRDLKGRKYNYVFLGNGSNILLTEDFYGDEYIFISLKLMDGIDIADGEIVAEAGCSLSKLSWFALNNYAKGYSFLEDIPGTVGGAVVMNAGTYDDNIGNLVNKVRYFDVDKLCFETVECAPEMFGKRRFDLNSKSRIYTSVHLKYEVANDEGWYRSELNSLLEIKKKRYLKQPRNFPNAGSVFVRPQPIDGKQYYVWQLLDDCGLRGFSVGDAAVSEQHPGFIVNTGRAKPADFLNLLCECKKRVQEKFGITLELEWKTI